MNLLETINRIISEVELKRSMENGMHFYDPKTYVRLMDEQIQSLINPNFKKEIFNFYSITKGLEKTYDLMNEAGCNELSLLFFRNEINNRFISIINNNDKCPYQDEKYAKKIAKYDKYLISLLFGEQALENYKSAKKNINYEPYTIESIYDIDGEYLGEKNVPFTSLYNKILLGKEIYDYEISHLDLNGMKYIPESLYTRYENKLKRSLNIR